MIRLMRTEMDPAAIWHIQIIIVQMRLFSVVHALIQTNGNGTVPMVSAPTSVENATTASVPISFPHVTVLKQMIPSEIRS